jgi:hypothetical protein
MKTASRCRSATSAFSLRRLYLGCSSQLCLSDDVFGKIRGALRSRPKGIFRPIWCGSDLSTDLGTIYSLSRETLNVFGSGAEAGRSSSLAGFPCQWVRRRIQYCTERRTYSAGRQDGRQPTCAGGSLPPCRRPARSRSVVRLVRVGSPLPIVSNNWKAKRQISNLRTR